MITGFALLMVSSRKALLRRLSTFPIICVHKIFFSSLFHCQVVCPLDASGRFTDKVTDFKGMYVKDADKHIIKYLKDNGRMVSASTVIL